MISNTISTLVWLSYDHLLTGVDRAGILCINGYGGFGTTNWYFATILFI